METVEDLNGVIAQKQGELAQIFEKAKRPDGGGLDMTQAQVEDVQARNNELTALSKKLETAKTVDEAWKRNQEYIRSQNRAASNLNLGGGKGGHDGAQTSAKSLGQMVVQSEEFKNRQRGRDVSIELKDIDFKTTMTTSAGYAPESTRTGKEVDYAVRRPVVADLIPQTPHDQAAVVYMEETTFTNAADTTAEAASAPESANAWTQRTNPLYKIATFLPVTEEQLKFVPAAQALIDNRLTLYLKLAEEGKLLTGAGSSDIDGFLHKSGVQVQAKGSDPTPDAFYKAITLVRATGFAEPDGFVIHPNDWQDVRLLRTTDGIYIWGSPAEAGPERLWGLNGVVTTAETEGTGLVGDFGLYSEIYRGGGVDIKISDSHSDYFIKSILAIKAVEYLALCIYRASAFCKVTGI